MPAPPPALGAPSRPPAPAPAEAAPPVAGDPTASPPPGRPAAPRTRRGGPAPWPAPAAAPVTALARARRPPPRRSAGESQHREPGVDRRFGHVALRLTGAQRLVLFSAALGAVAAVLRLGPLRDSVRPSASAAIP